MKLSLLFLSALLIASPAAAEWSLDGKSSSVSFVSVKNGMLAEVHGFKELEGNIDDSGKATLTIKLDSVDTMIPIRDERLRKMLFNTESFPEATVVVQLDNESLAELASGSSEIEVFGNVTIKDQSQRLSAKVRVDALQNGGVSVNTVKPVLVGANQFDLLPGIEALRAIAGLTSITPVAPVMFNLAFMPKENQARANSNSPFTPINEGTPL
jgi:polyisoprenoid-binding protein YceI